MVTTRGWAGPVDHEVASRPGECASRTVQCDLLRQGDGWGRDDTGLGRGRLGRAGCGLPWARLGEGKASCSAQSGAGCGQRSCGGGWAGCVAGGRVLGAACVCSAAQGVQAANAGCSASHGMQVAQQARAVCMQPAPPLLASAQPYLGRPIGRGDDRRHRLQQPNCRGGNHARLLLPNDC